MLTAGSILIPKDNLDVNIAAANLGLKIQLYVWDGGRILSMKLLFDESCATCNLLS